MLRHKLIGKPGGAARRGSGHNLWLCGVERDMLDGKTVWVSFAFAMFRGRYYAPCQGFIGKRGCWFDQKCLSTAEEKCMYFHSDFDWQGQESVVLMSCYARVWIFQRHVLVLRRDPTYNFQTLYFSACR